MNRIQKFQKAAEFGRRMGKAAAEGLGANQSQSQGSSGSADNFSTIPAPNKLGARPINSQPQAAKQPLDFDTQNKMYNQASSVSPEFAGSPPKRFANNLEMQQHYRAADTAAGSTTNQRLQAERAAYNSASPEQRAIMSQKALDAENKRRDEQWAATQSQGHGLVSSNQDLAIPASFFAGPMAAATMGSLPSKAYDLGKAVVTPKGSWGAYGKEVADKGLKFADPTSLYSAARAGAKVEGTGLARAGQSLAKLTDSKLKGELNKGYGKEFQNPLAAYSPSINPLQAVGNTASMGYNLVTGK